MAALSVLRARQAERREDPQGRQHGIQTGRKRGASSPGRPARARQENAATNVPRLNERSKTLPAASLEARREKRSDENETVEEGGLEGLPTIGWGCGGSKASPTAEEAEGSRSPRPTTFLPV